ncbi:uncharacterized protein LY89DRAFT_759951 [Mollisia scopiformis]|uniref:Aminoglycoside phosphotransferase domain-containing protein n=1 Tax=Mollisia scopiformis TaxID=149040 RepID=A0A194WTG2_MOLSC|nr:uncharacterized protein LY89DRAFT_759951 [Mollisia scopiformis]KUJ10959.1 hypothetical protein LY89DRAFT_759951 [Mollisia scopiformis]
MRTKQTKTTSKRTEPSKSKKPFKSTVKPTQEVAPSDQKAHLWEIKSPCAEPTGQWPKGVSSCNDGSWRKTITWLLTKVKDFISKRKGGCVLDIPPGNCVKFGAQVHLSEAFALRLVAEKTTIPVPRVLSAFIKDGSTYIVMEKINGITLEDAWGKMPDAERRLVMAELKDYFEQLRKIPHPRPGTICTAAADDHALYDLRIFHGDRGFGPFRARRTSIYSFGTVIRAGNQLERTTWRL